MLDPTETSVIVPTLATEWLKLVSVILLLAAGYFYARCRYLPVIRDLEREITGLRWQIHDLRYDRESLETELKRTQAQCNQMTDRAYSFAEENAILHGIIQQNRNG